MLTDSQDIQRLREIVRRQDQAIDAGIAALVRLSKKGSISKGMRETALHDLTMARNERLRDFR